MTAKVISLTEYKRSLINNEDRIVFNGQGEIICELPSPILSMAYTPDNMVVSCEDGDYIVYPDGSYRSV